MKKGEASVSGGFVLPGVCRCSTESKLLLGYQWYLALWPPGRKRVWRWLGLVFRGAAVGTGGTLEQNIVTASG